MDVLEWSYLLCSIVIALSGLNCSFDIRRELRSKAELQALRGEFEAARIKLAEAKEALMQLRSKHGNTA